MKKGIIVLLIMALVASCAFAGKLTGSAQIDFGYNLDNTDWGFKNTSSTTYKFSFEYDSTKAEVADHTTDVWAEIAATASATISEANAPQTAANIVVSAKITKANIHVGEITFGILNAGSTLDLASSYYLTAAKKPVDDTVKAVSGVVDGFTVSYKDWNGGFGAKGNIDAETYTIFAHVETPTFKFAEDAVAVNGGAYAVVKDNDASAFGASAKAAYASDDLSASVAADVAYTQANEVFLYEVAAKAAYKFVTVDAYVTPGAATTDAAKYVGDYAKTASVNAKVAASYTIDADDVTVALAGSVDAQDLLVEAAREIAVAATETCTYDELTVAASETYKVFAKTLDASVKATHKAEKFTAYVQVGASFAFDADKVVTKVPFEYGISTAKVVENATLSLTYKGLDFIDLENKLGTITASAKIAF